ncbi:MAG TPA: RpiB/LacA/LacB family sugar-phosphate isomerase, partial [Sphingomicrobium sp.]|nr:RpiB/LacA/LacB family sugar-phosphate isomerase [Sphingomicrobium sp.]
MKIAIAADHAGFTLKSEIAAWLRQTGHEVLDLGTDSADKSVDYPRFGAKLASAIAT